MVSFAKKVPNGEIVKAMIFVIIAKLETFYVKFEFSYKSGVFVFYENIFLISFQKIIVIIFLIFCLTKN